LAANRELEPDEEHPWNYVPFAKFIPQLLKVPAKRRKQSLDEFIEGCKIIVKPPKPRRHQHRGIPAPRSPAMVDFTEAELLQALRLPVEGIPMPEDPSRVCELVLFRIYRQRSMGRHRRTWAELYWHTPKHRDFALAFLQQIAARGWSFEKGRPFLERENERIQAFRPKPKVPLTMDTLENTTAPLGIATWNTRGLLHCIEEFEMVIKRSSLGLHIIGIQETWLGPRQTLPNLSGWKSIFRNRPEGYERLNGSGHTGGIGLYYRKNAGIKVKILHPPPEYETPHALWCTVTIQHAYRPDRDTSFTLGVWYIPPRGSWAWNKDPQLMKKVLWPDCKTLGPVVIMGDWNAHLTWDDCKEVLAGKNIVNRAVDHTGKEITAYLKDMDMIALNGGSEEAIASWTRGGQESTVDYIAVSNSILHEFVPLKIHRNSNTVCGSDHRLVQTTRKLPLMEQYAEYNPGWKVSALNEAPVAKLYKHSIRAQFSQDIRSLYIANQAGMNGPIHEIPIDDHYQQVAEKIYRAVGRALPRVRRSEYSINSRTKKRPQVLLAPYNKPKLSQAIMKLIKIRQRLQIELERAYNDGVPEAIITSKLRNVQSIRRSIKKLIRQRRIQLRDEYYEDLVKKLYGADPAAAWKAILKCTKPKRRSIITISDPADPSKVYTSGADNRRIWKDYFSTLGNDRSQRVAVRPVLTQRIRALDEEDDLDEREMNKPIVQAELTRALDQLKSGGPTPGENGIHLRFLIAGGKRIRKGLLRLFQQVWNEKQVPAIWQKGTIVPIFKAGDPQKCSNYRGITLLDVVSKVFCRILANRLNHHVNYTAYRLADEQNGFREDRNCHDHIYAVSELMHDTLHPPQGEEKKLLYMLFIDVKKAYDRVWREALWVKLHDQGVKGRMLHMLRALYSRVECNARVNGEITEDFDISIGLRQGCVLSPVLFDIFINDLILEARKIPGIQNHHGVGPLSSFFFADDGLFVADKPHLIKKLAKVISDWMDKWDMEVGHDKCGLMLVGHSQNNPHFELIIQGKKVPVVTEYKYLGATLHRDGSWKRDQKARLKRYKSSAAGLNRFISQHQVPIPVRSHIYHATAKPTALYSGMFWPPNLNFGNIQLKDTLTQFDSTQCEVGRKILGLRRGTAHHIVRSELGWLTVRLQIVLDRIRYYFRLFHMPRNRLTYKFFARQSQPPDSWRNLTETIMEAILVRAGAPDRAILPAIGDSKDITTAKLAIWETAIRIVAWDCLVKDSSRMTRVEWYCRFRHNPLMTMSPTLNIKKPLSQADRSKLRFITRSLVTGRDAVKWGIAGKFIYKRRWYSTWHCRCCGNFEEVESDEPDQEEAGRIRMEDMLHILFACPYYDGIRSEAIRKLHKVQNDFQWQFIGMAYRPDLITIAVSGGETPDRVARMISRSPEAKKIFQAIREIGSQLCMDITKTRYEKLWPNVPGHNILDDGDDD
jgi:exonuclease III